MENYVTLTEMLDAREARAALQQEILNRFHTPLICFTLNIPGPLKLLPKVPDAFFKGKEMILETLSRHGIFLLVQKEVREKTGYEGFFAADGDGCEIKKLMTALEESGPLGRIFDIDVLLPTGEKISREDISMKPRTCLLCSREAHVCSRSRSHTVEELVREISQILDEEFPL